MPAPPVAPSPIIPTAYHPLMSDAYDSSCAAGLLTADILAYGDFTASLPPVPPQRVIHICLPLLLVDSCFGWRTLLLPLIASVSLSLLCLCLRLRLRLHLCLSLCRRLLFSSAPASCCVASCQPVAPRLPPTFASPVNGWLLCNYKDGSNLFCCPYLALPPQQSLRMACWPYYMDARAGNKGGRC